MEPSGTVQFLSPHGTLPAGAVEVGIAGGPLSTSLLFLVGFIVVSVPPESLPHAIGESPANNTATASPRLTIAMFMLSDPSLKEKYSPLLPVLSPGETGCAAAYIRDIG
jgi:hypothetical protein